VGGRTRGVHDPLRDPLVVEVGDLLAEDEVLEEGGSPEPRLEGVLVVGDGLAEIRGERLSARIHAHAVERVVAGIEAWARAGARLGGAGRLGQRAAGRRGIGRLGGGAGLGLPAASPISAGLLALNGNAEARA
jgi:hypothetical protein